MSEQGVHKCDAVLVPMPPNKSVNLSYPWLKVSMNTHDPRVCAADPKPPPATGQERTEETKRARYETPLAALKTDRA